MRIIAIASLKGGVGKTAATVNLSIELLERYKVLTLDLDPQASATDFFLREASPREISEKGAYQWLRQELPPEEAIWTASGQPDLFSGIIPASVNLHKIGAEMFGDPGAMFSSIEELRELPFDLVLIDTPPGLSYEFRTGIHAADIILCPVTYDRWSMQGLSLLRAEVKKAEKAMKQSKQLLAFPSIVTEAEDRDVRELIEDFAEVTETTVYKSGKVRTALAKRERVKAPKKPGKYPEREPSAFYRDLAREVSK